MMADRSPPNQRFGIWSRKPTGRDEVAASVELSQLWQRVSGYSDPMVAFNPFDGSLDQLQRRDFAGADQFAGYGG